nr:Ig-like domain-containing protein [uncultured Duganella sp.]
MSGSGTLQVRVTNAGGSSTPLSAAYALDTSAPTNSNATVSFSADTGASGSDLITMTAAQNISGTLNTALASDEHVEVSLNNGASWVTASASGSGWTLNGQTLSGNNTLQVRVVDAAGNIGSASSNAYRIDTTGPTAALSTNVSVLKSGEAATITLTFNEAVDGLALGDLSATNGTLANLTATADPRVYTVQFTPNGGLGGLLGGVTLAANSYTDLAGNNGGGASSAAITINTLGPSVLITSNAAALKTGETANITFTFSSLPSGFTDSDIVVSGGTLGTLTNQGGGVYTAVFTPGANVSAPASITVTGGSYTDVFNNPGGAGLSPLILVDTKAPTLVITSNLSALKIGDTATVTFTFSEVPLGFSDTDVAVSNGSLSGLSVTANPLVYTATLTPAAGVAGGAVSITVQGSSYTDLAGNSGTAGVPPSISIDTLAPTISGASVSFSADTGVSNTDLITRTAAQNLSGTLSGALAAGDTVQVSLDNGASWLNASASGSSWNLNGVTLSGSNTLQVRVNDAAGNHGAAFSAGYVLDTSAPSVVLTSDLGVLKAGETANLTFTFTEAPGNFDLSSLNVSGGSVSSLAATGNPLVYTAVFTPATGQIGVTATVQVKANGYIDTAGNGGQASLSVPIIINTTLPSLLITADDTALKAGEAATLTFTFSSPPTGFTVADISYSNGALSGFAATANPLVYTALFTPTAGLASGTAGISVAPGSYTDVFGNPGSGGTGPTINIDTLAPSVVITSSASALKAGETALISFTFSEAPTGFTASDVAVTGGTLGGLTVSAGNPLVYTATFTSTAGIQNVNASITIGAGAFTDAAGNSNTGVTPTPPISIDTLPPVAVGNTVLFSADNGSSATDLVTNVAAQTISGTLNGALGAGEFVEVSLDNGASWNGTTGGAAWMLSGATLNNGSNTLQVRVTDGAGNHGAVYATTYVLDTTAPTVTITSNMNAVKAGETATISFTFSEAVDGFSLADISAGSGVLSNLVQTANPLVYTALYTPNAGVNGVNDAISVMAASYTDRAGNGGTGGSSAAIAVDTQAPSTTGATVVFSSDSGAVDLVTNVAAQDISGTLSANLLGGETVQVSLDNGSSWVSATITGANSWQLTGQTLSSGAGHSVQVRVSDAAGNHGTPFSAAYTLDQTQPTLVISSSKTVLNSADAPLITFTFSEAPIGFNAGSISATGGTLSGFTSTANPLVYTAVFTPTAGQVAGIGTVSVAPGTYTDLAGNAGLGGAVPTISYATVAPGVAILSDVSALKAGDVANITFKFSSAPAGFGLGGVTVGGGTLSGLSATADPLIYTALFTANAGVNNGSGTISVASGTFTDTLGNPGVGGAMAAIAYDTLAPTLSITSNASAVNSSSTALITFTFSEAPPAFALGDISAANGNVSNLVQTANPLVYTAVFTPNANQASAIGKVSVAAGVYTDAAGNSGASADSPDIAIDTLAPGQVGSGIQFSNDSNIQGDLITNSASQSLIVGTLSGGALAVGDIVEVSFDNGASWVTANATSSSWSLSQQTLSSGTHDIQVRVTDNHGNHGAVTSYTYVLDNTPPTVSISSDSSTLRAGQSATITFTFSEAPTGFDVTDLVALNGGLSNFSATANPLVYTVVLTPTAGLTGSTSVTLANNLYTDNAGNNGSGGSSPQISIDTLAPTLQITSSANILNIGSSATITFTFSDAPSAFALGSVSASNGVLSNLTATSNPLVYTATFTPTAGLASGNAVISVAGSAYADAAGNVGANAASAPIAVDTLAPSNTIGTVSFSADSGVVGDLVTNVALQSIGGTLLSMLGNGEVVQVSLDNGASWINAFTVGTNWQLAPQTLSGSGILQVRVADSAGNASAPLSAAYVVDQAAPGVVVTSSATTLKAGESATITFTFSEAPSGFDVSDLVALNGTLGAVTATANPLVYTVVLTPNANLTGAASVTLAPGLYTDLAGNAGLGASSPLITVDTSVPTLLISSSSSALKIGESATITFTFSELPVGFALNDIAVGGGTLSGFGQTANPLVYTALFTPTAGVASGVGSLTVANGAFLDAAGNAGSGFVLNTINYSTQAPTTTGGTVVFSNDADGDLVTNNPFQTISGTLSASLATGETVEVSLNNGLTWVTAVAPANGSGWSLPPTTLFGSGVLQVRVVDANGNHGPASSSLYVLDTAAPTVVVSSSLASMNPADTATVTFSFNEAPVGFSLAGVSATGGTLSVLTPSANPLVYTATFTPTAGYNGPASVTVNANAYTDLAGNQALSATTTLANIDGVAPTLLITSSASVLNLGQTALITFTFDEAPFGFVASDVVVSGGTLSGFAATANPLVYTAVFTSAGGVNAGSATIEVLNGSFLDAAGNAGTGYALPPLTYNTQAPTTTGAGISFSNDPDGDLVTNSPLQTISGTLSANLVAGDRVEVSLDNGQTWVTAATTPNGNTWALPPVTLAGSGVLQVRVVDINGNQGSVSARSYVLDTAAPAVSISSNLANLKAGDVATVTFTFTEVPSGFGAASVSATGGTLSGLAATANPLVYTASFTPSAGYNGAASVSVSAGVYSDLAGNPGAGASVTVANVDALAPTLAISSNSSALSAGQTALITFTFSEAPVGFAIGDISVSGGTLSGFSTTVDPLVYRVLFTPTPGIANGTASVSVAPNLYTDLAGNPGGAGAAATISINTQAPLSVAVGTPAFSNDTGIAGDLVTSVAAQVVSGALSQPLATGQVVQVSFDNGVSWQLATANGAGWSLAHTLTGSGVLRVRVADANGNTSPETTHAYVFDAVAPTVAVSSNVTVANGVTPTLITFTFSDVPVGFGNGSVAVSGGTLGPVTATANPLVYTATFTPAAGQQAGNASISVSGYSDTAGNTGLSGAIPSLQIDTVAPAATAGGVRFSSDSGASGDLITNQPTQTLSGNLSVPLAAGDVVQVSVDNGATWQNVAAAVGATSWSVTRTLSGSGTLVVRVADQAGNYSSAYAAPYTIDTTPPTVAISSASGTVRQGGSATFTLTLSDPATLRLSDLVVSGGTVTGFGGSGTTYTVVVTPPANSTTPITISLGGNLFSDAAGNGNQAATPASVAVNTNLPPVNPGTSTTVDGVTVNTAPGTDTTTGLPIRTISVPNVTTTRPEDNTTTHPNLADIPLGIAASGGNPGTSLLVSVPLGVGFEASGPAALLNGAMAMTDLIDRIDDHTAAGQATRAAMEAQAEQFLRGLDSDVWLQHATLKMTGVNPSPTANVIIDGEDALPEGSSGGPPRDTVADDNTAVALVIDARALPQGIGLQLDDVQFAAVIGAATVMGGAGQNFVIGDGEAQRIVLSTGSDNDTIYGNGGDDILGTAGGNDYLDGGDGNDWLAAGGGDDRLVGGAGDDVLQGGRSDAGQWQFFLKDGKVVGQHQLALAGATVMETVTAAELNGGEAILGFTQAQVDGARLETLSLLYHAAFERAPDLGGLNFWINTGLNTLELATGFLGVPEAAQGLMQLNNHDFVATLLENALGVKPAEAALASWVARLDNAPGDLSARAGVLAEIALTAEHRAAWNGSDGLALGGQLLTQEQGWIANSGDDRLEGGAGSDRLVGGDGIDTVVYGGAASSYGLALNRNGEVMIAEPDGARDTILQIERGEFNGVTRDLAFTQAGAGTLQEIGMLYQLTLDRAGDFAGFKYWIDSGLHGSALANAFTASVEFGQRFGSLSDTDFITLLYQNTLAQPPSAAVLTQWDAYLDNHSRGELVAQLATDVTLVGSQYGAGGLNLIGSL